MQIGMVGLGRMGAHMARRLLRGGHDCVVFDMSAKAVEELVQEKATGAASLEDLVEKLHKPHPACAGGSCSYDGIQLTG